MTTPGFVIAATSSGSGKTTIATGLMHCLAQRMRVAPFKVGPDYIDPGYHGLATANRGRNLDAVMCPGLLGALYAHGSKDCDLGIVEGVMGLFDGRIPPANSPQSSALAEGSTAAVAAELGLPVILCVDVRGMSQTVGAVIRGFLGHHHQVHIAGVILNKVGTQRHAAICTQEVEALGVPVLGAIPRQDLVAVPSRHLGLITAAELSEAQEAVARMGELVARHVDLDALLDLASCSYTGPAWNPCEASSYTPHKPVTIAMTAGPAFSFTYPEHVELLEAAGATVLSFDPLRDPLPDCQGLIIPGGFPEEHVEALSQRTDLAAQVRDLVAKGLPIHAECAGLLWLLDSLDAHPMLGVIPTQGAMSQRLTLGYRSAVALRDSVVYRAGERIIGHEFHHTRLSEQQAPNYQPAWEWKAWDGKPVQEGFINSTIHASYLHVHPAAHPESIRRFVQACEHYA